MRLPVLLFLYFLTIFASVPPALAAEPDMIIDTAERHARLQTQNYPGKVTITPGKSNFQQLPPCNAMEAFTPPGTKMIGKVAIGVRCLSPQAWTVLVPMTISTLASYVTTTRPLVAGQLIQADDLNLQSADLATLPTGAVSDPAQAIGKTLRNSIGAGQTLRSDNLLAPLVVRQGQTVKVTSKGNGFAVSSDGRAMNNAAAGQVVQVRMNSGQTVQGVARPDGGVEISF